MKLVYNENCNRLLAGGLDNMVKYFSVEEDLGLKV